MPLEFGRLYICIGGTWACTPALFRDQVREGTSWSLVYPADISRIFGDVKVLSFLSSFIRSTISIVFAHILYTWCKE